jgi:hypothetical protein
MGEIFRDVIVEMTEFRGDYPDVPIASHINMSELTEGDDNPFFVTLRIGKDNATSGNRNFYDPGAVRSIQEQAVSLGANLGHIKPEDDATAFPIPVGHWVGSVKVGETVWGKLYVPRTHDNVREMLRVKKATGGKVATSIYGRASREYDSKLDAFRVKELALETIDLATGQRAGVTSLATVPGITREMDGQSKEDKTMTDVVANKYDIIAEMTVKDAPYVPETVQAQIISLSAERRLVSEMSQKLGVDTDGVLARVAELLTIERKHTELVVEQINRSIADEVASQVMPDVAQVTEGVKAVREMVSHTVQAGQPKDAEAVKVAVAEAVKQPMVQEMAKLALSAMGKHERGGNSRRDGDGGDAWDKYMSAPRPQAEGSGA